jgi:hypothetical protein
MRGVDADWIDRCRREVMWQAELGLLAMMDAAALIDALPVDPDTDEATVKDVQRCWLLLQGCVSAAAALSRLLWPPDPGSRQRGSLLRRDLEVPDTSPLRPPRTVRNSLEHFDERLDWHMASGRGFRADLVLTSRSHTRAGVGPPAFRWFDPERLMLAVMDDELSLGPLLLEMRRLHGLVVDRRASAPDARMS